MQILVTAGNTLTPIDLVRGITNIFTGRTGARIALHAHERGHGVTLFTSRPEAVAEARTVPGLGDRWAIVKYETFKDLQRLMADTIPGSDLDAVIHCAAVSDYESAGIFAPAPGTRFEASNRWQNDIGAPTLEDRAAGKVKSNEPELWLRLVRTPKLIDLVRTEWKFQGILVKFKLEVGLAPERLLEVAERSRRQSGADLMVANMLEALNVWADIGPIDGRYQRVNRDELAPRLLDAVENLHGKRHHG
jgi:phosphopantothenate---cysteine ligase (CTP)